MNAVADKAAAWPHWAEWKRLCALGACSEPAQAWLRSFAHHRFHYYARHLAHGLGAAAESTLLRDIEGRDAWHLFESHLVVNGTRTGKRYKDWLFARLAGARTEPGVTIETGATLIMRDVVREYLRREFSRPGQISLHFPVGELEGRSLTLEDLIPATDDDPATAAARAEYPALAVKEARRFVESLPWRTRVAILAKILERSLSDPAVVAVAQCRKSVLSADYGAFRAALRARIEAHFADEGPSGRAEILLRTMQAIQDDIFSWGKSETGCARLFIGVEEGVHEP
ncbi:MAG: hypothetical protein K8T26_19530 [Lentisphaerae bacterium]|nr:hypothetical protein [Lentisphaerota bacterium]